MKNKLQREEQGKNIKKTKSSVNRGGSVCPPSPFRDVYRIWLKQNNESDIQFVNWWMLKRDSDFMTCLLLKLLKPKLNLTKPVIRIMITSTSSIWIIKSHK